MQKKDVFFDIKIAPVVFVRFGFPAVTPKQFFESASLVDNVAGLLDISPSKIRRVKIVRDTSRRRRAASDVTLLSFVIEDDPTDSIQNNDSLLTNAKQVSYLT